MSGPEGHMRELDELFPRTKFVPPATDARVEPRADLTIVAVLAATCG